MSSERHESTKLRPATGDDAVRFQELFATTLPAPLRQSPIADLQWRAHVASLARYGASLEDHAVTHDGPVVGRLLLAVEPGGLRVVDVAVLPEWRGRGIGTSVLVGLQRRAALLRAPLLLSVQSGARARSWYERLGFRGVSPSAETELPFVPLSWVPPATVLNESKGTSCPSHS